MVGRTEDGLRIPDLRAGTAGGLRDWLSVDHRFLRQGNLEVASSTSSEDQMPEIIIRCPITGLAVSTGLDTETIVFETLPEIEMPLQCPSCGETHHWRPREAWVRGVERPRRRRSHSRLA
jgi:hypothetical protein